MAEARSAFASPPEPAAADANYVAALVTKVENIRLKETIETERQTVRLLLETIEDMEAER